ncbi:hypothetical protein D3C81_1253640 [compost metagenome]
MTQHIARGDQRDPRVIAEIVGPPIVHQRAIQIDHSLIHQLHHQVCEHRLAQRRILVHRARINRRRGQRVRHAEAPAPRNRAILDHRNANAGHREGLHDPRQLGEKHIAGNPRALSAARTRSRQRSRRRQHPQRTERSGAGHETTTTWNWTNRHSRCLPCGAVCLRCRPDTRAGTGVSCVLLQAPWRKADACCAPALGLEPKEYAATVFGISNDELSAGPFNTATRIVEAALVLRVISKSAGRSDGGSMHSVCFRARQPTNHENAIEPGA